MLTKHLLPLWVCLCMLHVVDSLCTESNYAAALPFTAARQGSQMYSL